MRRNSPNNPRRAPGAWILQQGRLFFPFELTLTPCNAMIASLLRDLGRVSFKVLRFGGFWLAWCTSLAAFCQNHPAFPKIAGRDWSDQDCLLSQPTHLVSPRAAVRARTCFSCAFWGLSRAQNATRSHQRPTRPVSGGEHGVNISTGPFGGWRRVVTIIAVRRMIIGWRVAQARGSSITYERALAKAEQGALF